MSDWGWVTLGYFAVYAVLGGYVASLVYRSRVLKERLEEPVMRRYLRFVLPAGLVVVALVVLLVMLNSNLVYFRTPTEVRTGAVTASEQRFRLGGQVAAGTVDAATDGVVRFGVTDGREAIPVVFSGVPQQLFQEGIGVVVEGTWDGTEFRSDTMLIKHDEQYRTEDGQVYDEDTYELVPGDAGP